MEYLVSAKKGLIILLFSCFVTVFFNVYLLLKAQEVQMLLISVSFFERNCVHYIPLVDMLTISVGFVCSYTNLLFSTSSNSEEGTGKPPRYLVCSGGLLMVSLLLAWTYVENATILHAACF